MDAIETKGGTMSWSKVNLLRFGLVLLIVIGSSSVLCAKPVSIEKAKNMAVDQLSRAPSLLKEKDDIHVSKVFTITKESKNVYYVINLSPEGWVILSADDVAYPIIAYSYTGQYHENDHSPALDDWMANVKEEIYYAIENELSPLPGTIDAWESFESPSANLQSIVVDKLIETSWGQGGEPVWIPIWLPSYDQYCPYERGLFDWWRIAPTGCVATAMAQVMKYWSWPRCPVGEREYAPSWLCDSQGWPIRCYGYRSRYVTFNDRTYDWDIMPNQVAARPAWTHTPGEEAVQILMHDIGISVDMNYHPNGSGALLSGSPYICSVPDCDYHTEWYSDAIFALTEYFKYDTSADYRKREWYTDNDWIHFLKTELDNGRPVIYRGDDGGKSGHAFICDGYDTANLFHFNWGWDGTNDGWFKLDALTPGSHNFTLDHKAIFDLKPVTFRECDLNEDGAVDGYDLYLLAVSGKYLVLDTAMFAENFGKLDCN